MKKHAVQIIVGLILTAVLTLEAAGYIGIPLLPRLEALCYDLRLKVTMPRTVDPRIVIIDMDERSLASEGRWPWNRDLIARFIDQLFDRYHVAVVGFDMVFAERDTSSGVEVLERLAREDLKGLEQYRQVLPGLKKRLDNDALLASRLKSRPVVLGYYFTGDDKREVLKNGELPPPVLTNESFRGRNIPFVSMQGYGANLPELQRAAMSGGHFNPFIDFDGVCRKVPMLIEHGGNYYESLSVAVVRALFGLPQLEPVFPTGSESSYQAVEGLRVSDLVIPVDKQACALIPYRGGQGSFRYVSATDILREKIPAEQLEGAIVLVGTTAPGLMEHRSTPVSEVYPGVEVHANMVAGILDQNFRHRPAYARGADIATLLVSGLILSLWLPYLAPLGSTLLTSLVVVVVGGVNAAAWHHHLVLPLASVLLLVGCLYLLNMIYGFFAEARARSRLAGLFGQYIPPELVKEMGNSSQEFTMEGESRTMTVLFSDIRNFTTLSEGLDAKQIASMMNEYLTPMTRIVHRHRGTIDKYIGDAIMAFWGAPLPDERHAGHAVGAALDMQQEMVSLRAEFREKGWPEFKVGIGLSTGVMNVGNMGSHFRRAYTVLGDAVNLGSRLEGLTKYYGVDIVVCEGTRSEADGFYWRELDRVRVKGKEEPITLFEPLGRVDDVAPEVVEETEYFHRGLNHYRCRQWEEAAVVFKSLADRNPDTPLYRIYYERVTTLSRCPPEEGWDGVFRFSEK